MRLSEQDHDSLVHIQKRILQIPQNAGKTHIQSLLTDIGAVIGSANAFASFYSAGTLTIVSSNTGPHIENCLAGNFTHYDDDGFLRMRDAEFDGFNRVRREMGSGVYHDADMLDRSLLERATFHREAFLPAGMDRAVGMTARLPVGEAVFVFGFASKDDSGFTSERTRRILGLIHPVFEDAFLRYYATIEHGNRAAEAMAVLPFGAMLCDDRGTVIAANTLAQSLSPHGATKRVLRLPGPTTTGGSTLQYAFALDGPFDRTMLEKTGLRVGLTSRQSQVAPYLAQGRSDKAIARELGISVHTVRRHSEAIFTRLGVNSRGDVMLALMQRVNG